MTVYDSLLGGAVERVLCEVPTVVIAEDAGGIIGAEVDVEEELDSKPHETGSEGEGWLGVDDIEPSGGVAVLGGVDNHLVHLV